MVVPLKVIFPHPHSNLDRLEEKTSCPVERHS